jgi:transcriptional regulator with XRE-family HTH domain
MIDGQRLSSLLRARELSQSELARRVGVAQQTIYKLVTGASRGSSHLHKIARELGTTPAYLTGEVDDPDEGAPLPPPEPRIQFVTLPVALPAERALADAFEGVLLASERMDRRELARELAKRLPSVLRRAGDALPSQDLDGDDDELELAEAQPSEPPARRRASRR